MAEMTKAEAVEIFQDIWSREYDKLTKEKAIRIVLEMKAHSAITKAEMLEVLRWERGMK